MVRKPEPAPTPHAPPAELLAPDAWSQLMPFFGKVNERYLYWDDFKHKKMPLGADPSDVWRALRLARRVGARQTPVIDTAGARFWYARTDEVDRALHIIDQQAGGRVSTVVDSLSSQRKQQYLVSSLMEEAIASSQIEGAATTRRVAKDMLVTRREPRDKAERMIMNNYEAMSRITDSLDEPLTPELIVSFQASLTADTLAPEDIGRYRTAADEIIIAADEGSGGVLHVPPPAYRLEQEIARLCDYANAQGGAFEHPVLKAVVIHFWLAYLHPFVDGNGRTARALFYWYMLKQGYWLFEYLSVSRAIMSTRTKYYRAFLYSEIDDADLTYFITYHLHAVERALRDLWSHIERKQEQDASLVASSRETARFNERQRDVLTRIAEDGGAQFTIESLRAFYDVSYATARNDLLELAAEGYLDMTKHGRKFVFVAPDTAQT